MLISKWNSIRTVIGKNRLNLKLFNVYANTNVDANKIIEKKNTSGMYVFVFIFSHSVPLNW
jgi:hypothetical protein